MGFPLVVLAGGSTKANTDEKTYLKYRDGLRLGDEDWKDSLCFDSRHFLDVALDTYREAGFDPITVLGDPGLDELIENDAGAELFLSRSTVGEKLLHMDRLVGQDEMATVVAKDLGPDKEQLREYLRDVESLMDKVAIIPMVEGRLLVEKGFRDHMRHKTYVAKNDGDVAVLAFPQMYSFRPHRMNLDVMRYAADIFFPFRGNGIDLKLALTGLSKLVFNEKIRKKVGIRNFSRCLGTGLRARYARHEGRGIPGIPVPTYDGAIDAISPVLREPEKAHEHIVILRTRLDSLAMDFDTPREAGMVAGYRGFRHGYTDARRTLLPDR